MRQERADVLRRLIDRVSGHPTTLSGGRWTYNDMPVREVLLLLNFIPEGDLLQAAPDRKKLMKSLYEMSTQELCGDDVPNDSSVVVEAIAYIGALEGLVEELEAREKDTYDRIQSAVNEIEATIDKHVEDPKARDFAKRRCEWLTVFVKERL